MVKIRSFSWIGPRATPVSRHAARPQRGAAGVATASSILEEDRSGDEARSGAATIVSRDAVAR